MKSKEQLAEEHVNKRYPEAEWTTYQRNFAEQDFKAGYDAAKSETQVSEYDQDKLFMAYEESRADNTAHLRKLMQLQKDSEKANALIDEALDVLCECDLDKDGRALVEKIKQYKEIGK